MYISLESLSFFLKAHLLKTTFRIKALPWRESVHKFFANWLVLLSFRMLGDFFKMLAFVNLVSTRFFSTYWAYNLCKKLGKGPLFPLPLKFDVAACVKQVLVVPKTFPKKKHKVRAYAKSKVAIARKKMKISSTACTANVLRTACVKQKKRSQLNSDKIIRNKTELEKLAKSIRMAAVRKVSSKK